MRDSDEWVFFQKGEPQGFEEPELYLLRLKRDRLNRVIIVRYLQRCGWDIARASFWDAPEAVYFEELRKQ
jgi:hypothetical protein